MLNSPDVMMPGESGFDLARFKKKKKKKLNPPPRRRVPDHHDA